jgi:hypothetical protein
LHKLLALCGNRIDAATEEEEAGSEGPKKKKNIRQGLRV